jgi:hypothetical protein
MMDDTVAILTAKALVPDTAPSFHNDQHFIKEDIHVVAEVWEQTLDCQNHHLVIWSLVMSTRCRSD